MHENHLVNKWMSPARKKYKTPSQSEDNSQKEINILPLWGPSPKNVEMASRNKMSKYHFLLSKPGSNKETAVASATARARVALRSVFFSDWLPFLSAVCVKHGEEAEGGKKEKQN